MHFIRFSRKICEKFVLHILIKEQSRVKQTFTNLSGQQNIIISRSFLYFLTDLRLIKTNCSRPSKTQSPWRMSERKMTRRKEHASKLLENFVIAYITSNTISKMRRLYTIISVFPGRDADEKGSYFKLSSRTQLLD